MSPWERHRASAPPRRTFSTGVPGLTGVVGAWYDSRARSFAALRMTTGRGYWSVERTADSVLRAGRIGGKYGLEGGVGQGGLFE